MMHSAAETGVILKASVTNWKLSTVNRFYAAD